MVRRVIPLVLALAVAGAPMALAVCQAACASTMLHPVAARAADGGHPCHHDGSTAAPQLSQPHACDHGGDLPFASTFTTAPDATAIPLAVIVTSTATGEPASTAAVWTAPPGQSLPPGACGFAVPLRL